LAFKIIAILHNYTVGNVHKASGNCQQRPVYNSTAEQLFCDRFLKRLLLTVYPNYRWDLIRYVKG
jgi:hypothetical protein